MGIQALPNTTVRALGASQVLTDPASVVKELIDNAIDARATSIAIEISNNTVDLIQLRDNGHGIAPEDRPLVAKPHCTSKITCEDDLDGIGGTSLGFRGEAIASIAEMSSSLTISTRVEGEQVAAALKFNQQGEIVGQEKASLPVGTTVKITGFVKSYPVRNQNALKNSEKCLRTIKQTLKSYAFARPRVRLSLRVLKAKSDKVNWTYAPKTGGSAEDAAFKIIGVACASQCVWSVLEDQGFTMQAFLPKLDADPSKVSNIGPFISVDGRPVSTSRGTPKLIAKLFREALKKASIHFDAIKEPFLYMEMTCPMSSYDANVEPSKDDVLFENPNVVLDIAQHVFSTVYPPLQSASPKEVVGEQGMNDLPSYNPFVEEDDFVTSLEANHGVHPTSRPLPAVQHRLISEGIMNELAIQQHDDASDTDQPITQRTFRPNMYGCDEDDLDILAARPPTERTEAEAESEELRQAQKDVNISNPWVIAKLNAAARRPVQMQGEPGVLHDVTEQPTRSLQPDLDPVHLPTPRPSSPSPSSQSLYASGHVTNDQISGDGRIIGAQALPRPRGIITHSSSAHNAYEDDVPPERDLRQAPEYDYTLSSQASQPAQGTPLQAIPCSKSRVPRSKQNANKPFVQPVKDQPPREKVWFDNLENDGRGARRSAGRRNYQQKFRGDGLVHQGELGDLIADPQPLTPPRRNRDMRDFVTHLDLTGNDSAASLIETRNYPQRRRNLSEAEFDPTADISAFQALHPPKQAQASAKRRKTSEARAMREISGNARQAGHEDEFRPFTGTRASSRRKSTNRGKSRRLKSSLLPLERVPAGQGVHNLGLTLTTTTRDVEQLADGIDQQKSLLAWSDNSVDAYTAFVNFSVQRRHKISEKLYEILTARVSDEEMVQDLRILVENAFDAYDGGDVTADV